MLKGDDALTQQFDRNYRNLRVHTHVLELNQTLEFIVWSNEHFGKRYSIKGLKGHRNKNNLLYLIGGVTAFVFMPQAPGGPPLRMLNTEGQGLPGAIVKACTQKLTITMPGKTESLNVAVAGAIAMYIQSKQ